MHTARQLIHEKWYQSVQNVRHTLSACRRPVYMRTTEIAISGGMCEAEHHTWFCLPSSLLAAGITVCPSVCVCARQFAVSVRALRTSNMLFIYSASVEATKFRHTYVLWGLVGNALIIFCIKLRYTCRLQSVGVARKMYAPKEGKMMLASIIIIHFINFDMERERENEINGIMSRRILWRN